MSNSDEKRRHTRVPFETIIDLSCSEKIFTGCKTDNLSTKGVLVLGVTDLQLDDKCSLVLQLSGGPNITLTMKGVIQRVTDTGVGVEFTEIDIDSFSHLKNIIYYNSENPDIINETY